MVNRETKYKAEYMYNHLSETAIKIVNLFTKTLEISPEDTFNLITSNVTAITFLFFESSLKLYGDEKSMEILMKMILFRKCEYNQAITDDEIAIVQKYYGFTVKRVSPSASETCKI